LTILFLLLYIYYMQDWFDHSEKKIISCLESLKPNSIRYSQIREIFDEYRTAWNIPAKIRIREFIDTLLQKAILKENTFSFPGRVEKLFTWANIPLFEIVSSIKKEGYFSHLTAMYLHELTDQVPSTIYINVEQSMKSRESESGLSQDSIDRAFRNPVRVSKNFAVYQDKKIVILNGQYTNRLGVIENDTHAGKGLYFTNIERTLIDISVRPVYAGGVFEVLRAYERAKDRVSVNKLVATLEKMKFIYPYHQVVGFYLERGGYQSSQIDLLQRFDTQFNFYLAHNMTQRDYSPRWRLFFPKGL